jgi:hypothetical protein
VGGNKVGVKQRVSRGQAQAQPIFESFFANDRRPPARDVYRFVNYSKTKEHRNQALNWVLIGYFEPFY